MLRIEAIAAETMGAALGEPTAEETRAQVQRIIASPEFAVPERARKFLSYVVEEKLAGRGDRIKAFSIALEVFERKESFDAQNDPVVRVEAGRIRRALERYYLVAGRDDPVRIEIPKGSYVPAFTRVAHAPAERDSGLPAAVAAAIAPPRDVVRLSPLWRLPRMPTIAGAVAACLLGGAVVALGFGGEQKNRPETGALRAPIVVVAPVRDLTDTREGRLRAQGLTEALEQQLSRFSELTVVGADDALAPPAERARVHGEPNLRLRLEGTVRTASGRLQAATRLVNAETRNILWAETYNEDLSSQDAYEAEQQLARKVATTIAQPDGILSRENAARLLLQSQPFERLVCDGRS